MEKLELKNLTANSARSYNFYQIPCEIIDNPAFDGIDYGSKILYGRMLSRASLSSKNRDFIDENGDVYIVYKIEEIQADMRCGSQLAVKMVKQLSDIGLIEKKVRGQGKPTLIYVKDFNLSKSLNGENQNPKTLNFESQELLNSKSSSDSLPYNPISKIDLSEKDLSKREEESKKDETGGENSQSSDDEKEKKKKVDKNEYFRRKIHFSDITEPPDIDLTEQKRPKNNYREIINSFTADENVRTALWAFLQMRVKKKKAPTDHALELICRHLLEMAADSNTQIKILDQSTVNDWVDIFPLKVHKMNIDNEYSPTAKFILENKFISPANEGGEKTLTGGSYGNGRNNGNTGGNHTAGAGEQNAGGVSGAGGEAKKGRYGVYL